MTDGRAVRLAEFVLRNEGGWSSHPADRGGATLFGVTAATAARHGLDVRTITIDQARAIYVADYWQWDWVTSDALATKLFDIAVNMGPQRAVMLLQQALSTLGHPVTVDGVAGPQTRGAATRENQAALVAALAYHQADRYVEIVRSNPSQAAFIRGWMIRAMKGASS